jgi:SPP1 gp7 family putative phage head morphogenesis protein
MNQTTVDVDKRELRRIARERFLKARKAEGAYRRQLNSVAAEIGKIVKGFAPQGVVIDLPSLSAALGKYADLLGPWAKNVTNAMHADVARRDASAWEELSQEMGRELWREIRKAPTGEMLREMMAEQVSLITSLPRETAQRVHDLTIESIAASSGRAAEIAREILRSGHVSKSRAMLIARTETSRTASLLVEARAKYVGSTHYIWRTVGDSDVRPTHRKLNGKVFAWDDPPVTETTGERAHPGQIYNCRCWSEVILPTED